MKIVLLTHERELLRTTNTGSLALKAYPEWCERHVWSRVNPDKALVNLLNNHQAAILYPKLDGKGEQGKTQSGQCLELEHGNFIDSLPDTLIILDATWQEARKMIRRSAYLQLADKYALNTDTVSDFTLRRNQIEGGLCTLECIIEVCKVSGLVDEANTLKAALTEFQFD